MFKRILIANRGEIACRIIATCRRLGIETVAVHSSVDRHAQHVQQADFSVEIGEAAATDSYLRGDRIIAAARDLDAEAIHPGYGFLAENARFARDVAAAGLTFIGPRSNTIEKMGSKIAAKQLMRAAGVPVVPGYDGTDQSVATLAAQAAEIGYPVLIKASAGGGGKGMRIVQAATGFEAALEGAKREAVKAFDDDAILLEKYLREPRHIEVQVFADQRGNAVHLFERECSVQRRHQKIIEEAPAPNLTAAQRAHLHAAAVAAASAVDYVNAGTVEFIMDAAGEFYFMEMNTRLQVEHPVTELVTGVDLVEWQLRIAAGEPLPAAQGEISCSGHAVEARIYAEDPQNEFLPSTGRIAKFDYPQAVGVRMDGGIVAGDVVGVHYDPMLAKLCASGSSRALAVGRLRAALAQTAVIGCKTNLTFLRTLAGTEDFIAARMHTGYVDANLEKLSGTPELPSLAWAAAAAVTVAQRAGRLDNTNPTWTKTDGWQLNGRSGSRLRFVGDGGVRIVTARATGDGYVFHHGNTVHRVRKVRQSGTQLALDVDNRRRRLFAARAGEEFRVGIKGHVHALSLMPLYPVEHGPGDEETHPRAPMPGTVVALHVAVGDEVAPGQALLVMEGMKMEHTVSARLAGRVTQLHYGVGEMVEAEATLIEIDSNGDPNP